MTDMSVRPILKLAVCLFPDLTLLDFAGPVQVFALLEPKNVQAHSAMYPTLPPVQVETTYLSHNRAPVVGDAGPAFIPHRTYGEVLENFEQYDILLVPGGTYQSGRVFYVFFSPLIRFSILQVSAPLPMW